MLPLIDPIDAIRYSEERNCTQAADFLQLIGFTITAKNLEVLSDRKQFKLNRAGKISDQALERYVKKQPNWLSETPLPKLKPGMMTVREGLQRHSDIQLQDVRRILAAGADYFLEIDGRNQRHLSIPESWFRTRFGTEEARTPGFPSVPPVVAKVTKPKPVVPQRQSSPKPPAKPTPAQPKLKPAKSDAEVTMVEAPRLKDLQITADDGRASLVRTMEAVAMLQAYGYDITYNDLYSAAHTDPPKVTLVRKDNKRYLYLTLDDLEQLVDNPPEWLSNHTRRFVAIKGYKLTRDVQIEHRIVPSRLYEAISAGLVKAESPGSGSAQGQVFYLNDNEVLKMLADDLLCRFLRGEKVTIPEITEYRLNHPVSEEPVTHTQIEVPEAPEGAEVIDLTGEAESIVPSTSLEQLLVSVHNARKLIARYDEGIILGWSDDEFIKELASPL